MKLQYIVSIIVAAIIISAAFYALVVYKPESDLINEDPIDPDDKPPVAVGNESFVEAVNEFSLDIYKKIFESSEENSFISAYSIFVALAMTYEGALGETADEMQSVLSIQQDNESFHNYMKGLYDLLNKEDSDYSISTANALWVQENFKLLSEYFSVIQDYYGGDATEVDFGNPSEAANIINQWVEDNTNGLIKDLIQETMISPWTALILTNAIYFKGVWKVQFDPVNTTNRSFDVSTENSVLVETMKLVETEDEFLYTEDEQVQVLELPYTGDDLSMVIVLPKEDDLSSVIASVNADQIENWKNAMVETNVDIYLPKFTVETSYGLNDYLKDLGMNLPFTSAADFSGITGNKDLYIDGVVHKAYIDVNEEGTEAAAATAVLMAFTSNGHHEEPQRIIFDCNHPFIYLIQHKQTGTILFMGSVLDPSA